MATGFSSATSGATEASKNAIARLNERMSDSPGGWQWESAYAFCTWRAVCNGPLPPICLTLGDGLRKSTRPHVHYVDRRFLEGAQVAHPHRAPFAHSSIWLPF